jgi:hypothetical protein
LYLDEAFKKELSAGGVILVVVAQRFPLVLQASTTHLPSDTSQTYL